MIVLFFTITDANGCSFSETIILTNRIGCMDYLHQTMTHLQYMMMDHLLNLWMYDTNAINFDNLANNDNGTCMYCDISINQLVVSKYWKL